MTTYSDETKAAWIYGLRARNSTQYFYVGCTRESVIERFEQHLYDVKHGFHKNKHFVNKVRKIGFDNIAYDILETVNLSNQFQAERQWIKKLISEGHKLVNRIHNEIHYSLVTERKLTREEYWMWCKFVELPPPSYSSPFLNELSPLIHETLKAGLEVLNKTGCLLDDYFDNDCQPTYNEASLMDMSQLCQILSGLKKSAKRLSR